MGKEKFDAAQIARQVELDLRLSKYFDESIVNLDDRAEAKSQAAFFLDLAVGNQPVDGTSAKKMTSEIRDRGKIARYLFSKIIELLEIHESDQALLIKYWDKQ